MKDGIQVRHFAETTVEKRVRKGGMSSWPQGGILISHIGVGGGKGGRCFEPGKHGPGGVVGNGLVGGGSV